MFARMLYGPVRAGAVARPAVSDFEDGGGDTSLTVHEKGHKMRRIPVQPLAAAYLRAYLTAARLEAGSRAAILQSAPRKSAALSGKAMTRGGVLEAVERRCQAVGSLARTAPSLSSSARRWAIATRDGGARFPGLGAQGRNRSFLYESAEPHE